MGNSPKVVKDHYFEIVDEREAREYWDIEPLSRHERKIIALALTETTFVAYVISDPCTLYGARRGVIECHRPMPETTYLKAACQHCKGHIEYPSELAEQSVECPHCKQMTTLPPSTLPPPLSVINPARASIDKASSVAGVGCLLQGIGVVCFVLAILTVKTVIPPLFLASSDFGSCSTVAGKRHGISARYAVVSYRTPVSAFVHTATPVFVTDDFLYTCMKSVRAATNVALT
jgi:hypothetical protein